MKYKQKVLSHGLSLLTATAALIGAAGPLQAQEKKPNILFIMSDDVGFMQPSCYHRGLMVGETPNIDRIAREGAIFMDYLGMHSILQRYVPTADLDKVYAAVGEVLANEKPAGWSLKAFKYYYIPWKHIGLAGIVVEPTDDLLKLQQKLIDAVAPFTHPAEIGTAAAFVTTPEDPDINQPTIDYVATFVPKATGKNFNPHVTVGIASQEYLKKMLAEPFDVFTFSPAGASVYQLGNYGTARKKLIAWEFKP